MGLYIQNYTFMRTHHKHRMRTKSLIQIEINYFTVLCLDRLVCWRDVWCALVGRCLSLGSIWGHVFGRLKRRGGLEGVSSESWEPVYGRSLPCLNVDCGNSVVAHISICNWSGDWLKTAATEIAEGDGRTMCETDKGTFRIYFYLF